MEFPSWDGNEMGLFWYPPRPAPKGWGLILINRFENFFKNPGRVWVLPRPASIIYKINLI